MAAVVPSRRGLDGGGLGPARDVIGQTPAGGLLPVPVPQDRLLEAPGGARRSVVRLREGGFAAVREGP